MSYVWQKGMCDFNFTKGLLLIHSNYLCQGRLTLNFSHIVNLTTPYIVEWLRCIRIVKEYTTKKRRKDQDKTYNWYTIITLTFLRAISL
jgi:hypothetical protein